MKNSNRSNIIAVVLKGNINYDARVQKFIESLVNLGYKIKLIVWNWTPIEYKSPKGVDIIEFNMSNYKIPKNSFITFALNLKFCFLAAKFIKNIQPQYCHFNDLNTFATVLFLKKSFIAKFIYDAHELFPEKQNDNIKKFVWSLLERIVIGKAEAIIVPERNRAIYVKSKYKLQKPPVVINNFPKYYTPNMSFAKEKKKKLGLEGKKVYVYQGVIKLGRKIEDMVGALLYLPEDFVFLIIGYSHKNYDQELFKLSEKLGVSNRIFYYGKVKPENMLDILAIGDVGVAFYDSKNNLNNLYCAPNKIFDYLMAGLKILSNATPAFDILKNIESVSLIRNINSENIGKSILKIAGQKFKVRHEIKKRYSWENLEYKIKTIYEKC